MTRLAALLSAGLFTLALAAPAAARGPITSDSPSCGGGKDDKKDEKKNPSADPQCGGGKDDKKNPSADPQCGDGKDEKKDEKKNPSAL